jgi:hypothetical protein
MATVVTGKEANLRVLRPFRLNGEHIEPGSVVSKDEFADKGDWSELCVMTPQTCTQTDDPVTRAPSPRERAAAPTKGGKSAAMP